MMKMKDDGDGGRRWCDAEEIRLLEGGEVICTEGWDACSTARCGASQSVLYKKPKSRKTMMSRSGSRSREDDVEEKGRGVDVLVVVVMRDGSGW
jgi:hypothetical protein